MQNCRRIVLEELRNQQQIASHIEPLLPRHLLLQLLSAGLSTFYRIDGELRRLPSRRLEELRNLQGDER